MIKSDSVSSISSNQNKQKATVLTPPPMPTTSGQEFSHIKLPQATETTDNDAKTSTSNDRSELLKSICNFKRGELRKVNSN